MEIQLNGRLVTCSPEEYKRLIELNLIKVPTIQSSSTTQIYISEMKEDKR